jgi:hypothetical protein
LCRDLDPDVFFGEDPTTTAEAKAICGVCPSARECLAYALESNEQYGIWGAMTAVERRGMRQRYLAAPSVEMTQHESPVQQSAAPHAVAT